MRTQTPGIVRPPWRSSASWPLQVQNVDSIHWRTGPSEPLRRGSFFAVWSQEAGAEAGDVR